MNYGINLTNRNDINLINRNNLINLINKNNGIINYIINYITLLTEILL